MITFKNISSNAPYTVFQKKYHEALESGQKNIEAIAISSFDKHSKEVDSRFVNLKFIDGNKFIFFSNYNSPKSVAFKEHNQIGALFYWQSTNTQIRMRAKITKTSKDYNQNYFQKRSVNKNALAICSNQSEKINSYEEVKVKYDEIKNNEDLTKCPDFWGGYSFVPYYFEFWEGHESRLNRREAYEYENRKWNKFFLQP